MKAFLVVAGLLGMFVSLPIWFYLQYCILASIQATPLMWFLFWVYVPVTLFIGAVVKIAEVVLRREG